MISFNFKIFASDSNQESRGQKTRTKIDQILIPQGETLELKVHVGVKVLPQVKVPSETKVLPGIKVLLEIKVLPETKVPKETKVLPTGDKILHETKAIVEVDLQDRGRHVRTILTPRTIRQLNAE